MRLDLDRADSRARLALDQHALTAAQRAVAGQEIVQMAGLLETDRDNFRQRRRAFKRIDICHYLLLTPHRMTGYRPPILRLHPRIGILSNRRAGADRSVDTFHDRIDRQTISQAHQLRPRLWRKRDEIGLEQFVA